MSWLVAPPFGVQRRDCTHTSSVIYATTSWWKQCTGNSADFSSTNPLWIASWASAIGPLPAGWRLIESTNRTELGPHRGVTLTMRRFAALPHSGSMLILGRIPETRTISMVMQPGYKSMHFSFIFYFRAWCGCLRAETVTWH